MFMNGFRCKVTNVQSTAKKIGTPQLARRCGADTVTPKAADPSNCTVGAKQPLYWYQAERSTFFEGTYAPPFYNDLYGFPDGAQLDIFVDQAGNQVSSGASGSSSSSVAGPTSTPAVVSSSSPPAAASSSTSSPAPANTPANSGTSNTGNTGTSNAVSQNLAASSDKAQHCKRRTAEAKRKRNVRRAAGEHKKRRSFANLFA